MNWFGKYFTNYLERDLGEPLGILCWSDDRENICYFKNAF